MNFIYFKKHFFLVILVVRQNPMLEHPDPLVY